MKISIITLHRVPNYGSVLQAWALQQVLTGLGHEPELVNYRPDRMRPAGMLHNVKHKSDSLRRSLLLRTAARLALIPSYIRRFYVFNGFARGYLRQTTTEYHTLQDLEQHPPNADLYLTGSDQVWNAAWNGGIDPCLFLEYARDKKCYSYAASFGREELEPEEEAITRQLLEKYRLISLREDRGVDLVRQLGFDNCRQVPDPTLLLNQKDYLQLASKRYAGKSFIFLYNINREKGLDRYAKKLSKHTGLPIYYATYQFHDIARPGHMRCNPSPADFLSLLVNAQYVVTDSFHCTVLSALCHRQLCVYYPARYAVRLKSAVRALGLADQVVNEESAPALADQLTDNAALDAAITAERERGMAFIREMLQNAQH